MDWALQAHGETVAQRVRLDQGAVQAGLFAGAVEGVQQRVHAYGTRAATVGKEPRFGAVRAPRLAQIMIQRLGQGREALLVPLANHPKPLMLRVHAIHRQRHRLAYAQPAVIHTFKQNAIRWNPDSVKQRLTLGVFKRHRQTMLRGRLNFL